jgi:predicted O-methyltransferase YrrM
LHREYDFVYVDGDHTSLGVLKDGINAMQVVAPGGVVAFDDYTWRSGRGPTFDPGPAIDALIVAFADKFEVIDKGVQVWLRRK